MNLLLRLTAPLAVSCALATATQATTLVKMSTEQLTATATDIVIGTCKETRSVWVNRTLVTLATVAVDESLKGGPRSELTVVLPGGVDASRPVPVAVTLPGAPQIAPRDNVILFLEADAPLKDGFQVVGFSQGKLSIVRDAFGRSFASPTRGVSPEAVDLAAFKSRVKELVRTGAEAGRNEQ